MNLEFKPWPKISRLFKNEVTITEKIDGTNSCIIIQNGVVGAQSRNRIITPEDDNFGFASWVEQNKDTLKTLGEGYHYGEWAGPGIQKNPHGLDTKTFFLFNSYRWGKVFRENPLHPAAGLCYLVPVLYEGKFFEDQLTGLMRDLQLGRIGVGEGKETKPEGIMIFFHAFGKYLKHTFENQEGKWKQ